MQHTKARIASLTALAALTLGACSTPDVSGTTQPPAPSATETTTTAESDPTSLPAETKSPADTESNTEGESGTNTEESDGGNELNEASSSEGSNSNNSTEQDTSNQEESSQASGGDATEHDQVLFLDSNLMAAQGAAMQEDVESALQERTGGTVSCDSQLIHGKIEEIGCTVDGPERGPSNWRVYVVDSVNREGYSKGTRPAALYVGGSELDAAAKESLLGSGGTYTAAPLLGVFQLPTVEKSTLEEGTLALLNNPDAAGSLTAVLMDGTRWEKVECESNLDTTRMKPVECTATISDGSTWFTKVYPAHFPGGSSGVLVDLGTPQDV